MEVDCVEEETGAQKWKVQSLYEFQYYKCPDSECTYLSKSKQQFAIHIHENHAEALYTWDSISDDSLSDIEHPLYGGASAPPTPDSKVGAPEKPYLECSPEHQNMLLQPYYNPLKQFCEIKNIEFSRALGKMGSRFYHHSDQAKLFQMISNGEDPLAGRALSTAVANSIKEQAGMGQELYNKIRSILQEAGLSVPSRYQLDKFRLEIKPVLEDYKNGKWQHLFTTMKSTLTEIFDVHDLKPESEHLNGSAALGFDLSGTHKQFQFKDMDIDTTKLIYGKWVFCFKHVCVFSVPLEVTFFFFS